MSEPRDPFGQEPTDEPLFKTTLSHADVERTRRKAPRRTSSQASDLRWWRQILRPIGIMAAIVAILAALLAAYDIAGIQQQGKAPLTALQQFCSYEADQDYFDAYNMVSNEYAHLLSPDDFQTLNTTRDQRYGTVTGCSQLQRDYLSAFGWAHAAFSLTVTTTRGTYHGTALLALEMKPLPGSLLTQTVWTVDQVTPDAHLD